jgi:multidrug resistance efflux pump
MAKGTSRRAWWVAGVVLLVGTVAGTGWVIRNPSAGAQEGTSPGAADPSGPLGIIAFGHVDVKDGVRRLFPLQTGRVTWVAPEGKMCEKGEVVLRLDDQLAKEDVARAKAGLQDAQARYEQAKVLPEQHDLDIKAQKEAVKYAESLVDLAEKNQDRREKLKKVVGAASGLTQSELDAGKAVVVNARSKVTLEQSKLDRLKKIDPTKEVERALADVNAKKADLDKAEKAVGLLYTVRAPMKGTILRARTAAGELTGPQSPIIPVEFCPEEDRFVRTEVMQDWAAKVRVGQECEIQDDAVSAKRWKGKVTHVSDWFTHRRSIIQEPFQLNDVRTLECLVAIEGGAQGLRIGQRLRVTIKQGGP